MSRLKNELGNRYGRLLVVAPFASSAGRAGNARWLCECDCGDLSIVTGTRLRDGKIVSCGCYRRERPMTHGMADTQVYNVWKAMRQRCNDPRDRSYARYGGRGISVCARWQESFSAFIEDMGERPAGLTLERIDNDGNYEPGNCRWATHSEQRINQRRMQVAA